MNKSLENNVIEHNGKQYLKDAKGSLVPVEMVKPLNKLMDQTISTVLGFAENLSDEIARFRQHTFDDVDSFVAIAAEKYQASYGGKKGNVTLTSFDGCSKVVVSNADLTEYTAEILAAKELVDECLNEWASESRPEIRAIINKAFSVDKQGNFNRADLRSLLQLNIEDGRWRRAMEAIRDSEKTVGSKRYVRIYRRASPEGKWEHVSLDIATA